MSTSVSNPSGRVITNVAFGERYLNGQLRLRRACAQFGVEFLGHGKRNTPPHESTPYAFKPWAIELARNLGYRTCLWADASADLQHDPRELFELIEREGVFVSDNPGWVTGQWSSDKCLALMGMSRDAAMHVPHCSSLVLGVCFAHDRGRRVFEQWRDWSTVPGAYEGGRTNESHCVSSDARCLGHRHDQTVLSIVAHRDGVKFYPMGKFVDHDESTSAVFAQRNV